MNRFRLLLLMLVLSACYRPGANLPKPARTGDANSRLIVDAQMFTNAQAWQRTPWWRAGDEVIDVPVFVLLASDGSACITTGAIWGSAQPRHVYTCAKAWRFPR
jgi:hypothetical protein